MNSLHVVLPFAVGRGIQRSFWRCEAAFQAVYYKGPWPFINRAWGKAAWHRIRWPGRGMNRTRVVIDLLHDGGEVLARMVAMETSYWSHRKAFTRINSTQKKPIGSASNSVFYS